MPTSTFTPEDEKQNEALNPGQQDYDRRFNDLAKAEEKATFDGMADNFDKKTADPSQEDANIKKLNNQESEGAQGGGGWQDNTTPKSEKTKGSWKKKGPLIGIGGGVGIVAILFSGFIGPSMMLPSLSNMAFAKNDSRGTLLERRIVKVLERKFSTGGDACKSTKISCRKGMLPKSMVSAMGKKGIIAVDSTGKKIAVSGNGYMDTKPAGYTYNGPDGKPVMGADGKPKIVMSDDFIKEYKNNPIFRKAFKSAYNMRFLGYNGRYIFANFFRMVGIKLNGGSASDGDLKESNAKEKLAEKTKSVASADDEAGAKNSLKNRLRGMLEKTAKKMEKSGGDPILLTGVLGCAVINLPTFVAGAYRALQVAQVISLANDVVMSPAGMQQSGNAKAESISALGKLLTEKERLSDGTLGKSALDSQILQSAIGVNKNKVELSEYAPGYSLITNGAVQGFSGLSKETKTTCNFLMSPQAAVAVIGLQAGITAATGGIGGGVILALKGLGKLAFAMGAIEGAMKVAEETGAIDAVTNVGYTIVKDSLGNYVEGAHGEELGDALGVGMYAMFSRAGTAGGGAVLKTSQVDDFSAVMASVDDEYRDEAIATLSPFDISSHYTFLGSIASSLSLSSVRGNPILSSFSILGHIISSPLTLISKNTSADISVAESTCSYGAALGVEDDIAVNPAGYPCVGIPAQYLNMSRDEVFNLVADEIDEDTGEPKPDSDIALMMGDCSEGDIESMSGCTIDAIESVSIPSSYCDTETGGDCETRTYTQPSVEAKKRAAQSIYLFDQQIENILAGEDEVEAETPAQANTTVDVTNLHKDSSSIGCAANTDEVGNQDGYYQKNLVKIKLCSIPNTKRGSSDDKVKVNSRISGVFLSMINQMRSDLSIDMVAFTDDFRTMEKQEFAWGCYQRTIPASACGGYGNKASVPGTSNHQMGLALDFKLPTGNSGATKPGDKVWDWLHANAAKYGFSSTVGESWHWEVTGR